MGVATNTQPDITLSSMDEAAASFAAILVPLGRALFALIFIMSGFTHFSTGTIAYAEQSGVPMANLLVPLSGLLSILGGLSILLGYKARLGALLLIIFLVPVTLTMHKFWAYDDAMLRQQQMVHFIKNFALLGSALLICYFGAGPANLDQWVRTRKRSTPNRR